MHRRTAWTLTAIWMLSLLMAHALPAVAQMAPKSEPIAIVKATHMMSWGTSPIAKYLPHKLIGPEYPDGNAS